MPIEIRELQIRVTVNDPGNGGGTASPSGGDAAGGAGESDKQALIAQCIEETLRIIEEQDER